MIKLAKHDGIKTSNIVRRRDSVAELKRIGADEVILSTDGPIVDQVRRIIGPKSVRFAVDPVIGETGTRIFDRGKMLIYGSLPGEPISVGTDPRKILSGRSVREPFWLDYWFRDLQKQRETS